MKKPTFSGEIMLLGWRESHSGGATVTFQLSDPDDLEPFRRMTVAKGKTAGQRLACVLVEIGDDEQPAPIIETEIKEDKPKGGELAKLAGIWCNDPRFWDWVSDNFQEVNNTHEAAEWIRKRCDVTSRAELDSDKFARVIFHTVIREPFSAYLKGNG